MQKYVEIAQFRNPFFLTVILFSDLSFPLRNLCFSPPPAKAFEEGSLTQQMLKPLSGDELRWLCRKANCGRQKMGNVAMIDALISQQAGAEDKMFKEQVQEVVSWIEDHGRNVCSLDSIMLDDHTVGREYQVRRIPSKIPCVTDLYKSLALRLE